jgi:glutamate racemase
MIGVFDSGHGGLTVLRAAVQRMPERDFLYLGDHANAPYGNRSPESIFRLTRDAVENLFGAGCRLVLLACNTAAATALRRLQQEWLPLHHPDKRILGVLVPMVEAITGRPWMAELTAARRAGEERLVAVFATSRTVASRAFPHEIGKRAPGVTVVQQGCPHLAGLIEAGAPRAEIRAAVRRHAAALRRRLDGRIPDAVILGCTHYALIPEIFAEALPEAAAPLSQPELTALSLEAYLTRHPELDSPASRRGARFLTSGEPARVNRVARTFFGGQVDFERAPGIELDRLAG